MKLIIGIGNPGERYAKTRHNVGFMLVDALAKMVNGQWLMNKKCQSLVISHQSLLLAKPTTFMNNSGLAVASLINFYHIVPSDLYVIHDDLDIVLGEYKVQLAKGPKVHNGLNSIYEKLGTHDFWHVRVGIENRKLQRDKVTGGREYVLGKFTKEEKEVLDKTVEKVAGELMDKVITESTKVLRRH
jgi:PTH1 family peptidyl-tRNA hydrolase